MDLKSLLNDDKGDGRNASPSQPLQQKRPAPPPPLSTDGSNEHFSHPAYPPATYGSPSAFRRSSVPYSPGPSHSAHSYATTPHSAVPPNIQSPYSRAGPYPSPSPVTGSTSTGYFPPAQRLPSESHPSRTSSSPFEQPPNQHSQNFSDHRNSYHHHNNVPSLQQQHSQPQTPLRSPAPYRRESAQALKDSPGSHATRQRSSSGASYPSPYTGAGPSPRPLPNQTPSRPPSNHYTNGALASPASAASAVRAREQSMSVSPKTVVQLLPDQPPPARTDSQSDTRAPVPPSQLSTARQPQPQWQETTSAQAASSVPAKRKGSPSLAQTPVPVKRPRRIKTPPIWAQQKRGTRPLKKPQGSALTNGHAAQPPSGPVASDRAYEYSFTDVKPLDEVTRKVADFIFQNVISKPFELPLEVEAKIGRIIDGGTRDRLNLPIYTETIVDELRLDSGFESTMSETQHHFYNEYLNNAIRMSKMKTEGKKARVPMEYKHVREVDMFYPCPGSEIVKFPPLVREVVEAGSRRFAPTIRVTTDEETGAVTAKIIKIRLGDLNVLSPNSQFDWRVSINMEYAWDGDVGMLATLAAGDAKSKHPARKKDRISYQHQFCQIDLTMVSGDQPKQAKTHELEVEVATAIVREEGTKAMNRSANNYMEAIETFVNNVRTLARLPVPVAAAK